MSPLPFNIDGFALVRIADGISSTGTWRIDEADVNSYNLKMPGFSLLWSAASSVAGWHPLAMVQPYLALLAAFVVLPAYLMAVKVTGRRIAGVGAGLFVGIFGSFLMLTSSVTKESIGLLVFPVVVLLFWERSDPRKRALAVLLLLFLPFLHSLTTLITLGMVSAIVVLDQRRALARGRFSLRSFGIDVLTGPALAAPALAYYQSVSLPFLSDLIALDSFVLFVAIVILLATLIASMTRPARVRIGHRIVRPITHVVIPPAIGIAALLANAQVSLFAGTLTTQPGFLFLLPAIAAVAAFVLVGYQLLRRTTNRGGGLVIAMFVAPVALILFGFFRGLDPVSLVIVYRSVDFLDYALAILVGTALAAAWKYLRIWRPARAVLACGFLAVLLATTPMAWDTPAVFGVENRTTPEEFQALALLAALHPENVTTDQRLADIGTMWFEYTTDQSLPLKLRDDQSVTGFDYAVVLERWSTVGAQVHPAPNVVLSTETIARFLDANRVVYAAGPSGDRIFVVQILRGTG
jgi:hypothetical protein